MLQNNRHIRYMWFPYTDSVVVVANTPVKEVILSLFLSLPLQGSMPVNGILLDVLGAFCTDLECLMAAGDQGAEDACDIHGG